MPSKIAYVLIFCGGRCFCLLLTESKQQGGKDFVLTCFSKSLWGHSNNNIKKKREEKKKEKDTRIASAIAMF